MTLVVLLLVVLAKSSSMALGSVVFSEFIGDEVFTISSGREHALLPVLRQRALLKQIWGAAEVTQL